MATSKHFCNRIQQRGVHQSTVDLAISYGIKKGDKFILGKKQLKVVLSELDEIRKKVIKAVDQGGIIAVKNDGCLITTYRVNSFNQKLYHNGTTTAEGSRLIGSGVQSHSTSTVSAKSLSSKPGKNVLFNFL